MLKIGGGVHCTGQARAVGLTLNPRTSFSHQVCGIRFRSIHGLTSCLWYSCARQTRRQDAVHSRPGRWHCGHWASIGSCRSSRPIPRILLTIIFILILLIPGGTVVHHSVAPVAPVCGPSPLHQSCAGQCGSVTSVDSLIQAQ